MVRLLFNPKKSGTNLFVPESKSSKREEINLNPFKNEPESDYIVSDKNDFIPCKNLVGLENTHYIVKEWYEKSVSDQSNKFLLLIGPTGCGKTTLIESFCKEENILLYSINNTIPKKDLIKDILNFSDYVSTEGTNFFTKAVKSKKLILIDEYQNSQNDTLTLTDINNMLTVRTKFSNLSKSELKEISSTFNEGVNNILPPILIISSDSKGTKLSELKKSINVYYIGEINKGIMRSLIKTDLTKKQIDELLNKCKSDKRLLLNTIEFLKTNKSSNIDSYISVFYKDIDVNQFEFIEKLFDNLEPIDINEIFKVYESDGYLLSNLVHENYIDYNDDISAIANSADSISLGATIYSDIYDSTRMFVPEIHCANALYIPGYYSRSDVKKTKCQLRSSVINNRFNIYLNNKKIIDKINKESVSPLTIEEILNIKKFLTYDLIKSKTLNDNQKEYLRSLLSLFNKESAISSLELIYKYFADFKDSVKEPKTKTFTIKFKEKINKLH
jgi:GTPase SAR1 family protein